MRIAFYAPLKPPDHPVLSGDRSMARALISALRRAGHEVDVASRFRSYDRGDAARQSRLETVGLRLADRLARRMERGERPDLWFTYHLYHKAPDWIGPRIAAHFGLPYVVAEASFAPKQASGPWALGHAAAAEALRRADLVLQPNPADAECVVPLLASPDRLARLAPFLDTEPFRTTDRQASRSAIAAAFGVDPHEPWLTTVAMMREDQKLRSYLSLAESLVRLTDLPWRLILAGSGPAEPAVRAAFSQFGERVCWAGLLDRSTLLKLYKAADLYVWPAIKEAWGMALLEAQAAGLPVVAGDSGGVSAVVTDGESGLLVVEGDADAFAAAVRSLLLDPPLRERMRAAASQRAIEEHDITVAASFLDRHLRRLAAGPP
jgi:glycosyltransferase involved in cell wall biosynthesis